MSKRHSLIRRHCRINNPACQNCTRKGAFFKGAPFAEIGVQLEKIKLFRAQKAGITN